MKSPTYYFNRKIIKLVSARLTFLTLIAVEKNNIRIEEEVLENSVAYMEVNRDEIQLSNKSLEAFQDWVNEFIRLSNSVSNA